MVACNEPRDKSAMADRIGGNILPCPIGTCNRACKVSFVFEKACIENSDYDILAENAALPECACIERVETES